jgi:hypothetical protein
MRWPTLAVMVDASHYRKEAERCRELAAHSPDSDIAKRWRSLAADYDKLADSLEASADPMPVTRAPMQQQPMQQQPMQQQQAKTEPGDKE